MDPYNNAEEQWGMRGPAANPYAAPAARVAEEPADDLAKASRQHRLFAVLIDTAVVAAIALCMGVMLPGLRGQGGVASTVVVLLLLLALVAFGIYQIVLLYSNGQTFGKKLLGIKIVRSDGSRASLPRILVLRTLVPGLIGAVPYVGWIFSLANPLLIFGEAKRCIHDLFADTIVVDA